MIALVVLGLWTARGHLKAVWQQAKAGGSAAGELLSYRTAVIGLVGGLVVMGLWLWQTGLPWWAVMLFLGAAFAIFFALHPRDRRSWSLRRLWRACRARALWSRASARRRWGRPG